MQNDLQTLTNLGDTSIHWLRAIGVHRTEQLQRMGAVDAYLYIKLRGIKVSKVLLYALHGALTDTRWNNIEAAEKQQLLAHAERRELELAELDCEQLRLSAVS